MSKNKKGNNNLKRDKRLQKIVDKLKQEKEDKEVNSIISQKMDYRIKYQRELQGLYLRLLNKYEEAKELSECIKVSQKLIGDSILTDCIYLGEPRTIGWLESLLEIMKFDYQTLMMVVEEHKAQLKTAGFTDEQINEVLSGKIIKDHKVMIDMEEKISKPIIDKETELGNLMIELEEATKQRDNLKSRKEQDRLTEHINELKSKIQMCEV